MKNLLIAIVSLFILSSCTETSVKVKNSSGVTLYNVKVYYHDKDGTQLNNYLIADSLMSGGEIELIPSVLKADYLKVKVDFQTPDYREMIDTNNKFFSEKYKNDEYMKLCVYVEFETELQKWFDKTFINKYYINPKGATIVEIKKESEFN